MFSVCHTKMNNPVKADDIIKEIGGCGRFQWRLNVVVHMINLIVCFSTNSMTIFSARPSWICSDDVSCNASPDDNNATITSCPTKVCEHMNSTTSCKNFLFDTETRTMVSEVSAFCDNHTRFSFFQIIYFMFPMPTLSCGFRVV